MGACSKTSTKPKVQTSQAALQSILSGLSGQEKSELATKLGMTVSELEERITKFSFTLKELAILASIVESENNLNVRLSFVSNQSTYIPSQDNESYLPCYHYDPKTGFPGQDYIVDTMKPNFSELPALNILPDDLNRPMDYVFSAKYYDSGCGTRLLRMACSLTNTTLWNEKSQWNSDIAKRKANGEDVSGEKFRIDDRFIYLTWFDCHVPNSMSSNNAEQIIYHFLNKAEEGNSVSFKAVPIDGAGNWGPVKAVNFFILKELHNRVDPK